jgi:hypothetical protein
MTNNQSSIIDNRFKQFTQIAGSAQIAVSFQNRASSIKHQASSMQNKPNSPIVHLNLIYLLTMIYTISTCLTKVKNKPNSNPIKPKTNPILAQKSGWQSQFKPNCIKGKKETFFVDIKHYDTL